MVTQNALKVFNTGVDAWNVWRARNRWTRPDLSDVDLSGETLFGWDLSGAILIRANLARADLFAVDVTDASLVGADLRSAKLDFTIGLTQHQVDLALGDAHTVLPRGIRRPAHWI